MIMSSKTDPAELSRVSGSRSGSVDSPHFVFIAFKQAKLYALYLSSSFVSLYLAGFLSSGRQ